MILSNILEHSDGISVLNNLDMEYHVISENVWNLATYNPEYIISLEDCEKVSKEFPQIKFIFPNGKFPNFHFENKTVFNILDYYEVMNNDTVKHSNGLFDTCVITQNDKFRFDIKNLTGEHNIDTYGISIGQNLIQHDVKNEFEIYKDYPICIGTTEKQLLKINFLNKWAISFSQFPYSFGKDNKTYIKDVAYKNAVNLTYHDLYADIFQETNYKLSNRLKLNKKEILQEIKNNAKN